MLLLLTTIKGNIETVRQLITPQNINNVDENKMSALLLAAKNGNSDIKCVKCGLK